MKNLISMVKERRIQADKLLWRVLSDGAERFDVCFDLAMAWIEGGSVYYVADHVKARKKAALIHIDYENAGYTRAMDRGCFERFTNIFAVSEETKRHFCNVYPEYEAKTDVFHNIVNQEVIRLRAQEKGGFSDGYGGFRILTVGRLTWQKGYDIAIEATKILKEKKYDIRWYVLGEGELVECQGSCEGRIAFAEEGDNGFGYDPLFLVEGGSFASIPGAEKDRISHRGNALRTLRELLLARQK